MLNDAVAEFYAVALLCKSYHWNVRGKGFKPIHVLLDEVYDALVDMADDLAEYHAASGKVVDVTPAAISDSVSFFAARYVSVSETVDDVSGYLKDLLDRLKQIWEDSADPVLANMAQEMWQRLNKQRWLVDSHKPLGSTSQAKSAADGPPKADLAAMIREMLSVPPFTTQQKPQE